MICLTAGRRRYLERTIGSFEERVHGNFGRLMILDDSGTPTFAAFLKRKYGDRWEIVKTRGGPSGFTQAIRAAWADEQKRPMGAPYIFHLEEDFVFDRPVYVDEMVGVLESDPKLAQVALLRGAFFPPEKRAGGIIEEDPGAYEHRNGNGPPHLVHQKFFTTNPCVYRRDLLQRGWPAQKDSETVMSRNLVRRGYSFAFMGDGEPWITHIGAQRTGLGY